MDLSDDELGEELEMLPSHFTPRRLDPHTQSKRLNRRTRYVITFLLSTAGIGIVGYLFWPYISLARPPIDPGTNVHHDPVWFNRATSVKDAFLHAYGGYERYTTFPDDELKPISNSGQQK